jgi:hypothetical protein
VKEERKYETNYCLLKFNWLFLLVNHSTN